MTFTLEQLQWIAKAIELIDQLPEPPGGLYILPVIMEDGQALGYLTDESGSFMLDTDIKSLRGFAADLATYVAST